ncbi:MAG: hypothetical protein EHM64_00240 [Ignavibacteriae bacterium]|nr:MAG: hypothetical protein EHM64_00240 [Ignavibacteriota bacterium]
MRPMETRRVIPRALNAPLQGYDLQAMITLLKNETIWKKEERNAITLVKGPEVRVVFILAHAHSSIPKHQVFGPLTIHVVKGRLRIHGDSQHIDIQKGQILTLQPEVRHSIDALDESAFMMSLTTGPSHPAVDFGY